MRSNKRNIDHQLQHASLQMLRTHFDDPRLEIESADYLSEPERRNVILRLHLKRSEKSSEAVPDSVILKQSLPRSEDADDKKAFARFARNWAGLEYASSIPQPIHNVPRFYVGNHEHKFILIEDLGDEHVSLVDTLTVPNRDKAIAALERYMRALGTFHAASYSHTEIFDQIHSRIINSNESSHDNLIILQNDILKRLDAVFEAVDVPMSREFVTEIKEAMGAIYNPGPFDVLTHGDLALDNVFDHQDDRGLQLIDFEGCAVRNALLDATNLRMSMPTGWCAKAIPDDIVILMEKIYREELAKSVPGASDDVLYNKAYTQACAFHALQQMSMINDCLENDRVWNPGPMPEGLLPKGGIWNPEENLLRPRVLSRLQVFIDVATENNLYPNIRDKAQVMLDKVKGLWPDAKPLAEYPAFDAKLLQKDEVAMKVTPKI